MAIDRHGQVISVGRKARLFLPSGVTIIGTVIGFSGATTLISDDRQQLFSRPNQDVELVEYSLIAAMKQAESAVWLAAV